MDKKLYERIILRTGIIVLSILFLIYLAPLLFRALLPIILALILVGILTPLIKKFDRILPIKHKFVSYLVGTILLLVILFIIIWLLQFIINQVIGLIQNIIGNWNQIVNSINSWINYGNSQINLLPDFAANSIRSSLNSFYNFLSSLQRNAINMTLGFTQAFINKSNDIIFFIITFVVAFYIILGDIHKAGKKYNLMLTEKSKNNINLIGLVFKNSTWNYVKAQIKLAILCTILMAVALPLLGQQFFVPIALFLGFIDLLPMIGPIIVLLPWSFMELFIFHNSFKGLGLLVILIFWTGLRQIIAPKVIGDYADIHPILSVISLYAGLKLYGVMGAIFFPVVCIFIVGIFRSGLLDNWIYDYRLFFKYVSDLLDIGKRNLSIPDE